jgi:hypothetical protein
MLAQVLTLPVKVALQRAQLLQRADMFAPLTPQAATALAPAELLVELLTVAFRSHAICDIPQSSTGARFLRMSICCRRLLCHQSLKSNGRCFLAVIADKVCVNRDYHFPP